MPELILRATDLNKTFQSAGGRERHALRGVSFEVHKGEVLALVGPSGSGKSTCLRALGALETVDSGRIELCGEPMDQYAKKAHLIRRKTAMVFQHFELFAHLSVLENVTLALRVVHKHPRHEADRQAHRHLAEVGMGDYTKSYPNQLSGGQKQRVAIARALATEPELLLCDEPTSALDPELVHEFTNLLAAIAAKGMTMVVVTHAMSFAKRVSTRCLFLEEGRLWCDLASEEFFNLSHQDDNPRLPPEAKGRLLHFLSRLD